MSEATHGGTTAGGGDDWAPVPDLRTDIAHPARMYDFYLDGKDNFEADRAAAGQLVQAIPTIKVAARANRRFMHRAVRFAAESGIRRFLDVGTGIPTSPNVHELVQAVAPECRIVYTDNDPIVLAHARALLRSSREGSTSYVSADFSDPQSILSAPAVRELLEPGEPVMLTVIAVLHFFGDETGPAGLLSPLVDALPPGSMLALSHLTADDDEEGSAWRAVIERYKSAGVTMAPRPGDAVRGFFDGLEFVEPGLVRTHEWRPDTDEDRALTRFDTVNYAGVAVKKS